MTPPDAILPHGQWTGDVAARHAFDAALAAEIIRILTWAKCASVLDLGCGLGNYVRAFRADGFDAAGVDGHPDTAALTKGLATTADLAVPQALGVRDAVVCLEVGEHVPQQFEAVLLDNITGHAASLVLLSWAVPGQPGHGHVNCLPNHGVAWRMFLRGFRRETALELRARAKAGHWWFRKSFMVFSRAQS